MDFLERLSAVVCGKQYLFKQDDGMYYSKYHGCELEKTEVEEWILNHTSTKTYNPIGRKNKFGNLFN